MADIQITLNTQGNDDFDLRRIVVWTSQLIGYVVYNNGSQIVYRKTTDGGATWGAEVVIIDLTGSNPNSFGAWYDKWTPGNTGTLIHVTWTRNAFSAGWSYRNLDTATDTLSLVRTILDNVTAVGYGTLEIVRAKDAAGTLYAGGYAGSDTFIGFRKSTDNGVTWSAALASFHDANNNTSSRFFLLPGNDADLVDIWCVMHLNLTNTLVMKVYDASANTWSTTTISTGIPLIVGPMMATAMRLQDSHVIVVSSDGVWNTVHNIKCWDITSAAVITAKTNVITGTQFILSSSVLLSQPDTTIYVAYARGATSSTDMKIYYRKSTDGGDSWSAEQAYSFSDSAPNSFRNLRVSESIPTATLGRFEAIWFITGLDDLLTNFDNSVALSVPPPPPPAEISYNLAIDWNNDGVFAVGDDVTSDALGGTIRWNRGVDDELALPVAGTLEFSLKNIAGKYTPDNTSSSLFPNIVPYRKVRFRATLESVVYELFNGFIERIVPHPRADEKNTSFLCIDGLDLLAQLEIDAPNPAPPDDGALEGSRIGIPTLVTGIGITFTDSNPDTITRASGDFVADGFYAGMTIDTAFAANSANNGRFKVTSLTTTVLTLDAVHALVNEGPNVGVDIKGVSPLTEILDKANWPVANRAFDQGDDTLDIWWTDRAEHAKPAAEKLAITEQALIYVDHRGFVVYEARSHRQKDGSGGADDHLTAQATFNNDMITLDYDYSARPIKNLARITGQKRVIPAANAEIYSTKDRPLLEANKSTDIWTTFTEPVASAVTPVSGTHWGISSTSTGADDAALRANVLLVATLFGAAMKLRFTNSNLSSVFIVPGSADPAKTLIVNGKAFEKSAVQAIREDTVSQGKFFIRPFGFDNPFQGNYNVLASMADYIVTTRKDPQPENLQMVVQGSNVALRTALVKLRISDRIRVTAQPSGILGISGRDYFINKMSHEVSDGGKKHVGTYRISLASTEAFWLLGRAGFSELGQTTKLGL